jgi:hypothetical protein
MTKTEHLLENARLRNRVARRDVMAAQSRLTELQEIEATTFLELRDLEERLEREKNEQSLTTQLG